MEEKIRFVFEYELGERTWIHVLARAMIFPPMSDELTRLGTLHIISTEGGNPKVCPKCGSGPAKWEVRNYDVTRQEGDVVCTVCETRVRGYDAS